MAIPSAQIDTWFKQGPITSSSTTYQSIRSALTHVNSPIAKMVAAGTIKIDLQGSYAHDTNIRGDSDVDVIVHYNDTFHSNKECLPSEQLQLHEQTYATATYTWHDLRTDVITALATYYGAGNVDATGKKSLKILPSSGRLRADVVPVVSYRQYLYFFGRNSHSCVSGVALRHAVTNQLIINYPDQHYANAVAKQRATSDRYKELVRMFKNMRSCLVDRGLLLKDDAPSYFLQGLIYNVPDHLFTPDRTTTTLGALQYLYRADLSRFISQNGLHPLLGTTEDCWDPSAAQKTVVALCNLWDNWHTT